MKKKITLLILILIAGCITAFAQSKTIKGTVKDSKGESLPGVTVKVKGTNTGTATDVNGGYTISAPANGVLTFSSLGLENQEIAINGHTLIDVTMTATNKQLEEVVVIGYGTRAVKDVTGAISSIKADKLANDNPTSVTDILKGAIPGMSVAMNTSAKGGGTGDLELRGKVSLSGNAAPLIVLDGVIYPGQLADINPDDIDRIDVLRDPSALAVYGAQSGGGVVAITTKKGKGGTTISVSANTGIAQLEKNQQFYQGTAFLDWRADAARATNTANPYYYYSNPNNLPSGVTLAQFLNGSTGDPTVVWLQRLGLQNNEIANYQAGNVTDWSKLIFRNGIRNDYTASLQGRTDAVSYYMSGNFTKNENLIQGGEYKDARFRLNLEGKVAKFLTIGINSQFASRDESGSLNPFSLSGYDLREADWTQIINASPYGNMYNADGSLRRIDTDDSGLNFRNPFLGTVYNQNVNIQNVLFGNLFARVDLPFGIKYNLNFGPQIEAYRNFFSRPVANPNELAFGTAMRTMENRFRYNLDNILSWNKTFGIHNFDVTLLLTKNRYQSWYTSTSNTGLSPTDGAGYHNIGAGTLPVESSDDREVDGDGKMARLNYTLLGRYILTGTARQDGYSPFGLRVPRQSYVSTAFAWVLSDEKFMKGEAFKWLDYAKLRVGYGSNGNIPSDNPPDASKAVSTLYSAYWPTVSGGTVTNNITVGVNNLQNPNLTWERVTGTNLGLDLTVLNGRLNASIDVYNRSTTDQLVKRSIPSISGYNGTYTGSGSNQSSPLTNLGETQNRGIEISLDGQIIKGKNFSWTANGTFSLNRNKIIHIYGAVPVTDASGNITYVENNDIGNGWFLGKDINAVWDYKIDGVWQTAEAAQAAAFTGAGIKPGDFKLEDVDGDHVYTNADKQFLGTTTPSFSWSLRNDFHFLKNFDFSFMLVSSIGQLRKFNQALNSPGSVGFLRQNSYVWPYWTTDNPINDFARLSSGSEGTTINVWRSASFVRIQTVSLGYTFNNSLINKLGMKSAKIYVNATNPYVFTSWQWWDPQNDGPTPRFLAAGISATF